MEEAILDILRELERTDALDDRALTRIVNRHNKRILEQKRLENTKGKDAASTTRPLSKKSLMAYCLRVKRSAPETWEEWCSAPGSEERLLRTLQVKPRRTASGVATITVLTKPGKCSSNCSYCPNDLRMPKSYLHDEPACQRAERVFFDPYLQAASRCKALSEMGHVIDKVELIVLGGTWSDYPLAYRIWFVRELFRALNDFGSARCEQRARKRWNSYLELGLSADEHECAAHVATWQQRVDALEASYNEAFDALYSNGPWAQAGALQSATWEDLEEEHRENENARQRVVGLVVETRPERIDAASLVELRRLGCTKIQMGIQSLDDEILAKSERHATSADTKRAFELLRLFGFKTHVHAMVGLPGSTPQADKADYRALMTEIPYQPDEVKLYPCVLVAGTELERLYADGGWKPYREEELIDVLVADVCATPAFCRISRMIRDISAPDILAGNKKVNLRQLVEKRIAKQGLRPLEIRQREVSLADVDADELRLDEIAYETTATRERFLQWITPEGKIAGFLRLSLPLPEALERYEDDLAVQSGEAMIREVHVYGRVAQIAHAGETAAQHRGLGTKLVERACAIAKDEGYRAVNVISAVGTRGYYRKLGFLDAGLYQKRPLP